MAKILITGGTGFVGYHLAKKLVQSKENRVFIVDNLFRSELDQDLKELLKKPNIKLLKADLTNRDSWNSLGSGYDHVYHLASINGTRLFYEIPFEVLSIGITTSFYAIKWFRTLNSNPNAKILYTSSNEAYAGALEAFGQLPIPTPEDVPLVISDPYNPRWSYAGQKLIGELLFIHGSKAHNFRMSIVRPHNFYGPREGYEHVIPEIIERVKVGTDPFPIFGAEDTRSFCYIDDAVDALIAVMESEKTDGGTYHIGTNEETPVIDVIHKIFKIMDWHPKKLDIKNSPSGSVKRRLPHVSKIKKHTGWEAKISLDDGLKKMVEWYRANPRKIVRKDKRKK
jgi:nucleoside-diphosphate-sugar epimerase